MSVAVQPASRFRYGRTVMARLSGGTIALWLLLPLLVALLIYGPLFTNDGPVHINFARAVLEGFSRASVQGRFYELRSGIEPNMAVYWLGAALLKVFPAAIAESIIQWLCFAWPVSMGIYALRQIDKGSTLLALPMALLVGNRLFNLGLYNSCLSIGGFLLVVAITIREMRTPRLRSGVYLFLALALTFLCHASGFLMAVVAAGAFLLVGMWRHWRTTGTTEPLWAFLPLAAGLATGAALELVPLLAHRGDAVSYGVSLAARIGHLWRLQMIAAHGMPEMVTTAFFIVLTGVAATGSFRARHVFWHGDVAPLAAALAAVTLIALIIPDVAGGGWTHFRRSAPYPFFVLILLMAALPLPAFGATLVGFASGAMLLAQVVLTGLVHRDLSIARTGFVVAERLIGRGCTILPLMMNPADMTWEDPNRIEALRLARVSHEAVRYEMTLDRVVLYNWLARLSVYPARYRPAVNPHTHLFHWPDVQLVPGLMTRVDITGFERRVGWPVDFVLVRALERDFASPARADVRAQLERGYRRVYTSPDRLISLYRRLETGPRCMPPVPGKDRDRPAAGI